MGQEVRNGTVIERILPSQYVSKTEAEVFESIEDMFKTKETGSFHSDVVINTLIAGGL